MLNEADTRAKLIDPAIHGVGWTEDLIKREETAGAIEIIDGVARKQTKGRTDYTLRVKVNPDTQPVAVAVVEAKAEKYPPTHGLEKAKLYASCARLNVPFVFSSNGHLFVEYDRFTGLTTSPRPLFNFPSPIELQRRYENAVGFSLNSDVAKPLLSRYPGGEGQRRYYQDAAIRATLEKLARGEKRILLSLATGSGKTFIAVHLLKKIADAGRLKRALFVCDRDELRRQGLAAFQNLFGADAAEVTTQNPQKNARILIGTYQTLDVATDDGTANFLTENYRENYFSHIIIDECHRSAWGKWSMVLTRNPDAVQIGLTATPRKLKTKGRGPEVERDLQINADNLKHFGEPVYEYDMAQGIEDGYLAACEIIRREINIDRTGITQEDLRDKHITDPDTGRSMTVSEARAHYGAETFEALLQLPNRVKAMCQDLFDEFLATGGPEQKTIIFCVRDRHADDVAAEMNNLYAKWCEQNGRERLEPYAFKCTASVGGSDYIADLRGAMRHHFVATTVELITTGVDVPPVKNIVFFKYVESPIAFYQMVGRGTRIHLPTGKLMFRIYDYTNATRLFGEDFETRATAKREGMGKSVGAVERDKKIKVEGFDVIVSDAGQLILADVDGKAMPVTVEQYKEMLAAKLVEKAPTLDVFRNIWISPQQRSDLFTALPDGGRSPYLVRKLEGMVGYDLYDTLGELGYGMAAKTRGERAEAFNYKHREWLDGLPAETAAALEALASQFARGGTEGLENPQIFQTPEVQNAGGLEALKSLGEPSSVLTETKKRLFAS